jgi:hypothetical protein
MKSIEDQIKEAEIALEKLKKEKAILDRLTPAQRLAILLHDETCRSNHTDGCSWDYERCGNVHDWNKSAHLMYHGQAQKLLEIAKFDIVRYTVMLQKMDLATAVSNVAALLEKSQKGSIGFD